MWDSKKRIIFFLAIYSYIYQADFFEDTFSYDKEGKSGFIREIFNIYLDTTYNKRISADIPDISNEEEKEYEKSLANFIEMKEKINEFLLTRLKDSTKTHLIIQALLYCFVFEMIEYLETDIDSITDKLKTVSEDQKKIIIRFYLRICQQYVDSQSVSLVHALLLGVFTK
jgi:hypothetical protein